jgi:hypothetical protein
MIPFNLERAKQGAPICTRKGIEAKFIAHLDGGQPAPIVVEVFKKQIDTHGLALPDTTMMENYYLDGRHNLVHESEYDLFMKY